jgi:putative acetyltransferase
MDTRHGDVSITDIDPSHAKHLISDSTAMYQRLYPENSNHFVFEEELGAEGALFLGALIGEVVVGCVGLIPGRGKNTGEIKRLYVDPEYRTGGIGSALMDALEEIAKVQGFRILQLETGSSDLDAQSLYEKRGYRVVDPFGDYADDPFSTFYAKDLHA